MWQFTDTLLSHYSPGMASVQGMVSGWHIQKENYRVCWSVLPFLGSHILLSSRVQASGSVVTKIPAFMGSVLFILPSSVALQLGVFFPIHFKPKTFCQRVVSVGV